MGLLAYKWIVLPQILSEISFWSGKATINAIKNSVTQVDILQKQFNEDSKKRSLEIQDDDEEMPVKKVRFSYSSKLRIAH